MDKAPTTLPPAHQAAAGATGRHRSVIRQARNVLLLTAGLVLLSELIGAFRNGGLHPVLIFVVAFGVGKFLVLALWTRRKPFNAVLMGLATFIGINIFAVLVYAFEEKTGLYAGLRLLADGIVLKLVILATLLTALGRRRQLQQAQRWLTAGALS